MRTPVTTSGKEASTDNEIELVIKFVEIDLKHMWYHKDGQIVLESDLVSRNYIMIQIEEHLLEPIIFIIKRSVICIKGELNYKMVLVHMKRSIILDAF